MSLLVEIKERKRADVMIDRLAAVLDETGSVDDVLVISFDHVSLVEMQKRNPGIRTEIITCARSPTLEPSSPTINVFNNFHQLHPSEI